MSLLSRFQMFAAKALVLSCAVAQARDQKKRPEVHHAAPQHHSAPHHSAPHRMKSGSSVERRGGRVQHVHDERRHMDIEHHVAGGRRVSVERADHSRLVAEYGRGGYVEHPYAYGGHAFYGRTYYRYGRPMGWHLYRGYAYHGYQLRVWAPRYYYHPAFYRWAYRPWGVRVIYGWPWYHRPWYGYYGYYFAPYPYYVDSAAWLTDYAISQDLAADYQARTMNGEGGDAERPMADADHPALLTPDVKDEIDQEVKDELASEEAEASVTSGDDGSGDVGITKIFADKKTHVFVVGAPVDVEDADTGKTCSLTNGDVLRTTTAPGPEDTTAELTVVASKQGAAECAPTMVVSVKLEDLQEMQNSFRERIADGLQELQKKQGTDGIPAMPADAAGTVATPYAAAAPAEDDTAGHDLDQAMKDADASEKDVTAEEAAEPGAAAAPTSAPGTQAPAPIERRTPQ